MDHDRITPISSSLPPSPFVKVVVIGSAIDCRDASGSIEIGLKSHYSPIPGKHDNPVTWAFISKDFPISPAISGNNKISLFLHLAARNVHRKRFGYLRFRLEDGYPWYQGGREGEVRDRIVSSIFFWRMGIRTCDNNFLEYGEKYIIKFACFFFIFMFFYIHFLFMSVFRCYLIPL